MGEPDKVREQKRTVDGAKLFALDSPHCSIPRANGNHGIHAEIYTNRLGCSAEGERGHVPCGLLLE